jgi:hypothetical protein
MRDNNISMRDSDASDASFNISIRESDGSDA